MLLGSAGAKEDVYTDWATARGTETAHFGHRHYEEDKVCQSQSRRTRIIRAMTKNFYFLNVYYIRI